MKAIMLISIAAIAFALTCSKTICDKSTTRCYEWDPLKITTTYFYDSNQGYHYDTTHFCNIYSVSTDSPVIPTILSNAE